MTDALLEQGRRRVDWIRSRMSLLADVRKTFATSQPFRGLKIGMSLHVEPKTVVLCETLLAGGAQMEITGNYGTTQDDAAAVLRAQGMTVHGARADDWDRHQGNVARVIESGPDILLDNGADLAAVAARMGKVKGIRGGTEETTSGGDRLRIELAGQVAFPVIVINDSPIKQIAENQHAVGEGAVESFMRITNVMVNGRRFVVVGYGWCGRGIAHYLRSFGGHVAVVEVDPIKAMEAVLAGFRVGAIESLAPWGQAFITATAREGVVGSAAFARMASGTILANAGHFPTEIDVAALRKQAVKVVAMTDEIERFDLADGRHLILLTGGRMFTLAGTAPKGNSIEAMDVGFTLQSLSLERVATAARSLVAGPQPVPADINRELARRIVAMLSPPPGLD